MSFTVPLPPHTQLYHSVTHRSCSNKHTHTGALHCHWNVIAKHQPGSTPVQVQARGILQRPEEQSRTGGRSAKAAALRVNLNVQGCGIVAPPMHAPSRTPLLLPPSFTQSPYPPRSLVRDGQTSPHKPRLVVPHSTCPSLSPSPLHTALS